MGPSRRAAAPRSGAAVPATTHAPRPSRLRPLPRPDHIAACFVLVDADVERAECSGQDELYLRELVVGHWHDPDRRPNLCKLADVLFDRHNNPDCTGTRI